MKGYKMDQFSFHSRQMLLEAVRSAEDTAIQLRQYAAATLPPVWEIPEISGDAGFPVSMLNYLDIYPLQLPARYHDRVVCYTTIYITSNIPLEKQYVDIQRYQPETWRAFLRRIHNVIEFMSDGTTRTLKGGKSNDNDRQGIHQPKNE